MLNCCGNGKEKRDGGRLLQHDCFKMYTLRKKKQNNNCRLPSNCPPLPEWPEWEWCLVMTSERANCAFPSCKEIGKSLCGDCMFYLTAQSKRHASEVNWGIRDVCSFEHDSPLSSGTTYSLLTSQQIIIRFRLDEGWGNVLSAAVQHEKCCQWKVSGAIFKHAQEV